MNQIEQTRGGKTSATLLFSCIELKHISYLIIGCGLFSSILNTLSRIISICTDRFMNDNICYYLQHIDITLTLITHFGIHLFVALRSRLSSSDISSTNIFFKIGLLFIMTDLGLIVYPWFIEIVYIKYMNGLCLIIHRKQTLIIWTLLSDVFIGIYCLSVFVLPLRKHIKWETSIKPNILQKNTTSNGSNNGSNNGSSLSVNITDSIRRENKQLSIIIDCNNMSLSKLVHKIMIYSSIMILSTIILMVIAAICNNSTTVSPEIIYILAPLDTTINCWCIVMQFADININKMKKASICKKIIGFIQCDYCWKNETIWNCFCCFCCNDDIEIPTEKMVLEDNMSHTLSITALSTITDYKSAQSKLSVAPPLEICGDIKEEEDDNIDNNNNNNNNIDNNNSDINNSDINNSDINQS